MLIPTNLHLSNLEVAILFNKQRPKFIVEQNQTKRHFYFICAKAHIENMKTKHETLKSNLDSAIPANIVLASTLQASSRNFPEVQLPNMISNLADTHKLYPHPTTEHLNICSLPTFNKNITQNFHTQYEKIHKFEHKFVWSRTFNKCILYMF